MARTAGRGTRWDQERSTYSSETATPIFASTERRYRGRLAAGRVPGASEWSWPTSSGSMRTFRSVRRPISILLKVGYQLGVELRLLPIQPQLALLLDTDVPSPLAHQRKQRSLDGSIMLVPIAPVFLEESDSLQILIWGGQRYDVLRQLAQETTRRCTSSQDCKREQRGHRSHRIRFHQRIRKLTEKN